MTRRMREGDVLIVVRVPRGERAPPGFKHSDAAIGTHHGRHSTHATKLIRKEVMTMAMKKYGKKKK